MLLVKKIIHYDVCTLYVVIIYKYFTTSFVKTVSYIICILLFEIYVTLFSCKSENIVSLELF